MPCVVLLKRFRRPASGPATLRAGSPRSRPAHRQARCLLRKSAQDRLLVSTHVFAPRGSVAYDTELGLEGNMQLICFYFYMISYLQKSYRNRTEFPTYLLPRFSYMLLSYSICFLSSIYMHINFFLNYLRTNYRLCPFVPKYFRVYFLKNKALIESQCA